jgi:hypothetical protein
MQGGCVQSMLCLTQAPLAEKREGEVAAPRIYNSAVSRTVASTTGYLPAPPQSGGAPMHVGPGDTVSV